MHSLRKTTRLPSNILGGAYPNHCFDVSDLDSEEVNARLLELVKNPEGEYAAEMKICVVSFQQTPPGIPPYMILVGLQQTINDSSDWGDGILEAW